MRQLFPKETKAKRISTICYFLDIALALTCVLLFRNINNQTFIFALIVACATLVIGVVSGIYSIEAPYSVFNRIITITSWIIASFGIVLLVMIAMFKWSLFM
ncbi:MAG: hypothetical protein HUJ61_00595 [Bacilli bacterium]|nr:hypothetical protein [Bacilli bacterium]